MANAVYLADPHLGPLHLRDLTEPVYRWWQDQVTATELRVFSGTGAVFLVFTAALLLNLVRNRFWCRYLCPLGGMLGLFAVRPLLRLTSDPDACNSCLKCTLSCPAAAQPEKPGEWLATECFGCWNCVGSCSNQGLDFKWFPPLQEDLRPAASTSASGAPLASAVGGVAALSMMRITPAANAKTFNPALIRPPGARAERGVPAALRQVRALHADLPLGRPAADLGRGRPGGPVVARCWCRPSAGASSSATPAARSAPPRPSSRCPWPRRRR